MSRPEYWAQRLPEPDRVLRTPSQIGALNQKFLRAEPTAADPLTLPEWINPSFLLAPLEKEEAHLLEKHLFDRRGRRIGKRELGDFKKLCALEKIPDLLPVRFGVIVEECSLRTFPTMEPVVEEPGKLAFDLLQQTTLHPGTMVAVLWESRDGKWGYLVSSLLRGWVQKEFVAMFENKKALLAHHGHPKVVVTERNAPFYQRPGEGAVGEWVMGTVLYTPSLQEEGNFYRIERPVRNLSGKVDFSPVYVLKEMVQEKFLPLTQRQILIQAFKLFEAPYGWGGLNGGWDCSSFLRDLFLTMGVELPRNSGPQSRIGKLLANFPKEFGEAGKKKSLGQAAPAATFVKLNGHIMLYLGKTEDRHYVIHSTSGYRKPGNFAKKMIRKDKVVTTFRVLVSDMELGKGGKTGSLLERTVSVNFPFTGETP